MCYLHEGADVTKGEIQNMEWVKDFSKIDHDFESWSEILIHKGIVDDVLRNWEFHIRARNWKQ